ncbi:MAG: nucleotide pyrophosphohydrolase [Peptostreptococcaceae bacterium]|nr:nucleotide pyrophosphohydrolase [Peptostreptococcaceae bacterium]
MKNYQNLDELQKIVKEFISERNWEKAHGPKNLAMSIAIEAAELMEIFQWQDNGDYIRVDDQVLEHIGEEISDVMIYCISMANFYNLNIGEIICDKFRKNAKKYPVE